MNEHFFAAAALAVAMAGVNSDAHAQTQRSGGEAQKFMQQYQQLSAEKTGLQGQVAQLQRDLDAAKGELAAVKKERDALKRAHAGGVPAAAVSKLTASKETAERSLELSKQRMTQLVGRFRELGNNLKDVEADRAKLREDAAKRSAAFDKCAEDNLQLYEINADLLDRYEHVGLFTRVSAAEPFTKLTRTRIENLVDEYRERAQQLRAKKSAPPDKGPSVVAPQVAPPQATGPQVAAPQATAPNK